MRPEPHELQELVRDLHRRAVPWLPAGSGSRLEWGPAVQPGPRRHEPLVLSTAALNRIVEHNPGDFTVTVQAGTPLVVLQQELARHQQWLSVDWPWGTAEVTAAAEPVDGGLCAGGLGAGSVGGLVARGLAGGYRQRYMGVRDQLIGIALLRADGTAARAGGKVVKNVAGYDLMRPLCGSWGSLALITEVTLRTQPLPPQRRGLWLHGPLPGLQLLARWVLNSSLSPERLDWHRHTLPSPQAAAAAGGALLISLASISPETLADQLNCIADQARQAGLTAETLERERLEAHLELGRGAAAPRPHWLLRVGVPCSQVPVLLDAPELRGVSAVIGAGSGLGDLWADADQLPAYRVQALRRRCQHLGGQLTVLRQPPGPPDCHIPAWLDAPSRPLIEAVKRQFDPKQQLARGRLPGVQPLPQHELRASPAG